ncbi:unnamed protein product [Hymenolepis diminuta]|uniref:Glyoxalase n=1 Tax=Hymenolepis diminuta TaxID=6216 RepID=A0A0R3STU6_HYMDI|nr:unnamed protein product [Hymenolepis diminuta]VUZ56355.1 unnamed protein product [Hymenolepis diminuta]
MISEVNIDKEKVRVEAELYQFNIDQVNNFIKFYNNYGHRLYLMEKGLSVDTGFNQIVGQFPEDQIICESMEEIEYVRNQFQKLCEENMKMLKEHIEETKPPTSMIALMKTLMKLGKHERRIGIRNVKFF